MISSNWQGYEQINGFHILVAGYKLVHPFG